MKDTSTQLHTSAGLQAVSGLAARGLKPVAQLAANREHGDRLRYMAGCRCTACRRANSMYESARQKARKAGDWNGIVSAEKARLHIKALSDQGIGRRAVGDASDIADTVLSDIIAGRKTRIRARTERAILAVTREAAADHAYIPAKPTWALLNSLIDDGYSKAEIARRLGRKRPALQLKRDFVTVRNAYQVERLFEQLRCVSAKKTTALLNSLRNEGYTSSQINQRFVDLVRSLGEEPPPLLIKNDRIPARTAALVERLYEEMTS